jgi:hypothetical protein
MAEIDDLLKNHNPLVIQIDDPLKLRVTNKGQIEIECYQGIGGSDHALRMILSFSPIAGGQLVQCIRGAIESGALQLVGGGSPSGVQ